MSGIRQFTKGEADRIRAVLSEQPRTKTTRDKLRAIGFYISDFGRPSPLTVADFDRLIGGGEIIVTDVMVASAPPAITQPKPRPSVSQHEGVEAARERYRPDHVRHLMVGESPPAGGTFFYNADSMLFCQTHRAFCEVFGSACGEAASFLRFFRDKGFFLDDLCPVPVNGMSDINREQARTAGVGPLAARIERAKPQTVIVVMMAIISEVRQACALAHLTPTFVELPFPGRPEHQMRFINGMTTFLGKSL